MKKIEESKNTKRNPGITRRGFVKGAVAATGAILLESLAYATKPNATKPKVAAATKYLVFDPALCTGCGLCRCVCSTIWSQGRVGPKLSRISVVRNPFGTGDDNYSPQPCLQCENPPCMRPCPVNALMIDNVSGTNARVIIEDACIGCAKCQVACPYEPKRIFGIDPDKKIFIKCHLCYGNPQCVRFCPNGSLKYQGPPEFIPRVESTFLTGIEKPMVEKSYWIYLLEDREAEIGYPRDPVYPPIK